MTTVYFYGQLSEFIEKATVVETTVRKAINLIASQIPGMRKALLDGAWVVSRGSDVVGEEGLDLLAGDEVHVRPALAGASNGLAMVVLGAALIATGGLGAAAFALTELTAGALVGAGIGLAVGGALSMFMGNPQPDYTANEANNQQPSFLFNGPTNTSTQGLPVPVVIGRCRVGSVVVSAGIEIADLTTSQFEDLVSE